MPSPDAGPEADTEMGTLVSHRDGLCLVCWLAFGCCLGLSGSEPIESASLCSRIGWSQLWSGLEVELPLFPGIRSSVDGIGAVPTSPLAGDTHSLAAVNIGCSWLMAAPGDLTLIKWESPTPSCQPFCPRAGLKPTTD